MRIAMVTAECEPFAKTGGLGDAVDGMARALGERGHRVDVYLPRYGDTRPPSGRLERRALSIPVGVPPRAVADSKGAHGDGLARVELISGAADGYRIRLVDHPPSFDRPGIYGPPGSDHPDNAARFALLGRTALEAIRLEAEAGASPRREPVAILHGHDWQSGPAFLLAARRYRHAAAVSGLATVLTCHNLAYHGWTPAADAWQLGLDDPPRSDSASAPGVDLLRAALTEADMANTVSPTFARESLEPAFGAGLEDLLRARGGRYVGILNGLDGRLWDPATDAALAARYSAAGPAAKALDKADLLRRCGLTLSASGEHWDERGAPLLAMIGRLDPQKGFDLLTAAAAEALELGIRLVVLGSGDAGLMAGLRALASSRPDRLAVIEAFDRAEARRIYAGADAFLMPSRFEPCGQGQMIALRYGTPPIVRATGGLVDTVIDADADPGAGTGFGFGPAEPEALLGAMRRALRAYRDRPRWAAIMRRGMAADFSWATSAAAYEAVYERALAERRGRSSGASRAERPGRA